MRLLGVQEEKAVSDVLYAWACGEFTARQCRSALRALGFDTDLRTGVGNTQEIWDLEDLTTYEVEF